LLTGRWKKPLTAAEVRRILRNLGFEPRPKKGTSHEHWVPADPNAPFRKVTVDEPKAPFEPFLIASMARQAGVDLRAFYQALNR
jgi:predicted RNA binding protein YcfA (HicA-like mRNA interferase family)